MLVVMMNDATEAQVARVVEVITEMGYEGRPMPGAQRTTVGLVGNDGRVDGSRFESLDGVAEIIHVSRPYKQVSREWRQENTLVTIAPGVVFGGKDIPIIAGPCSVENEHEIALAAQQARDERPDYRSSRKHSTQKAHISWPRWPTAFRSVRATCRTTRCCGRSADSASRCFSSAVCRRRSSICC